MTPIVASAVFAVGIAGLFWLDRDPEARTSKALWIPTVWLLFTGSRPVSFWLGMAPKGGMASVYLEGSPIDRAVFMVLVAAALAVVVSRKDQVGPILRKNWPIVLFFSYALFSVLWSGYPFVTFKHWIKGIGDVAIVLIVLTEPSVMDAIRRLVTRVGFVLVPLSVLFIKYYPALGRWYSPWTGTAEYTGVATQKNGLGEICCIFGLGLLWRFRKAYNDREDPSRRRRLAALGTVIGMAIWLLWMCNSLTSICALAMAGAVMLLSTRPAFHRRPVLVHLLVVALLGISAFALFGQKSKSLVEDLGRAPSLSGRTLIWPAVLSVPVSRLVGAGYETFWLGERVQEVARGWGGQINEAHDGYVEMLLNLGWIGVALLGLLIVTGYRNVIGAYHRDPDAGGLRLAYLLGALIVAFTEAAFRMMDPTWIFFLLATVALPVESAPEGGDHGGLVSYRLELGRDAGAAIREGAVLG